MEMIKHNWKLLKVYLCMNSDILLTGYFNVFDFTVVQGSPRKSPYHTFPQLDIFTSITYTPFTINFTTLAYPVPPESGYVWSRRTATTMLNWTTIHNSDKSMKITISGLQSNLTIYNVTHSDLGMYRVVVTNSIGRFSYTLNLTAAGKPDTPAQFENVEDLTTEHSVTLQWMPSFNGGLDQYFVLTYSQVSHNTTKEEVIQDSGSNVMKHTFEGLASGTRYLFQLHAKTHVGKSSTTEITVTTKRQINQSSIQNLDGAIAGGTSTGVAVVVVIIIVVMVYRKRSRRKKPSIKGVSSITNDQNVYQNLSNAAQTSLDSNNMALYERLQHSGLGPDQYYQQLSAIEIKTGPTSNVYENLQLSHPNQMKS